MRRYVVTAVDVSSRYAFAWSYQRLNSTNTKDFFRRLGIVCPYWNYKGQPYKNGHIEKYNRTIQEEFIDENEILLDDPLLFNPKLMNYLLWYNTKRPHWSLKLKSPVDNMLISNSLSRMRWTETKGCLKN